MAISRRSLGFPDQRNRSNHAGRHGGVDAGRYLRHHDVYGQCNVDSLPFDDQGGHTSGNQSLERAGYERNAAHSSRDVTDEPDRRVLFLFSDLDQPRQHLLVDAGLLFGRPLRLSVFGTWACIRNVCRTDRGDPHHQQALSVRFHLLDPAGGFNRCHQCCPDPLFGHERCRHCHHDHGGGL